ncbi:MAG: LysE/ArgO family amino acid transporter [Pseudomonadota bacterium]
MSGLATYLAGFTLGLSLILAIGAQNAFVLRQGLRREHVFAVVSVCALSDVILIAASVAGFAVVMRNAPWIGPVLTYGGAAFLLWYGLKSIREAFTKADALTPTEDKRVQLKAAVMTCLALTWLNPHVYLDTVLVLGAVSADYTNKIAFAAGASTASIIFFFVLGYGARLLAPVFADPRSWQVLDGVVGLFMIGLAVKLVFL